MSGGTRFCAFISLLLQGIAMGQQYSSARRPLAPASGPATIEEREATASPAVRAQLAKMRQEIAAENLSYQVGNTAALDFPINEITGLIPPRDLETVKHERALERSRTSMKLLSTGAGACSSTMPSFDWRKVQGTTPVRDQGNCGSCWAFATHGSFEGNLRLTTGIGADIDTSEQNTIDCNPVGYSCAGGWWAFPQLLYKGTSSEAAYPYAAQDRTCKNEAPQMFHGVDWDYVQSSSVSELKKALCEHGPLAIGVAATPKFAAYAGGVFKETNASREVNHAVTLIGWNEGQKAWIIKNSWSAQWGETGGYGTEKGYMRIAYGSNSVGYGAAWTEASTALELETDNAWRSIAPLGNKSATDITTVGGPWETSHQGWNSHLDFDDSNGAGWKNAVLNAKKLATRPDIKFIWSSDPSHNATQGGTPSYFRKTFQLNAKPKIARLTVLADDDAQVYINGNLVVNDHDRLTKLEFLDVTQFLQAGANLIAVKAHDSKAPSEGLYLSLRVGAQQVVNPGVKLLVQPGTKQATTETYSCPANAGYVGMESWTTVLTNSQAAPLSQIFVEIQSLSNDNLFVTSRATFLGSGDVVPVEAGMGEAYIDGELSQGESVEIPFTVCLKNKNPYQLVTNVLAMK